MPEQTTIVKEEFLKSRTSVTDMMLSVHNMQIAKPSDVELTIGSPSSYFSFSLFSSATCSGVPTNSDIVKLGVCYVAQGSTSSSPSSVIVTASSIQVTANIYAGTSCTGGIIDTNTFPITSTCIPAGGSYAKSSITSSASIPGTVVT